MIRHPVIDTYSSHRIEYDTGILVIEGQWMQGEAEMRAWYETLHRAADECRARFGCLRSLVLTSVVLSAASTQPLARMNSLRPEDRCATVAIGHLAALQSARLAKTYDNARCFSSEAEARAWLLSPDPAPKP